MLQFVKTIKQCAIWEWIIKRQHMLMTVHVFVLISYSITFKLRSSWVSLQIALRLSDDVIFGDFDSLLKLCNPAVYRLGQWVVSTSMQQLELKQWCIQTKQWGFFSFSFWIAFMLRFWVEHFGEINCFTR